MSPGDNHMKTIWSNDYLSRYAIATIKDTILDYDDIIYRLNNAYEDIQELYDKTRDDMNPDVRSMMCLILSRTQWAIETTKHVRSILDRRVLYYSFTRDDTQSHT